MIKNPTALLDKLENHDLHLHPIFPEQRAEVFENAERFDDGSATHFLMQGSEVIWAGKLSCVELWVNSHFR